MAVFGLFSNGKAKGGRKSAKRLASKVLKAKKTKKKSRTCEFC